MRGAHINKPRFPAGKTGDKSHQTIAVMHTPALTRVKYLDTDRTMTHTYQQMCVGWPVDSDEPGGHLKSSPAEEEH